MKNKTQSTVLITGTSSGIGQALAHHLRSKDYRVIGTSRNPKAQAEIRQLKLDVTNDASVQDCIKTLQEENIKIDVLINNAGIAMGGTVEDTTIKETKDQFETNYLGTVRMIKAIVPLMRTNEGGKIINISSMAGLMGMPFQAHYSASKFAVEGLTESLRTELKPFNIKVCNINPGDFKTSLTAHRKFSAKLSSCYESRFNSTITLYEKNEQDGPSPIKIAQLVERLLKQKSAWKIRYVVGSFDQTIAIWIKRILGPQLFEKILMKSFKL